MIDSEIIRIQRGTCEGSFGRSIRETSCYGNWKAEECRMFLCYFAPILLHGQLPRTFLNGVRLISDVLELVFRPFITKLDLQDIHRLSVEFVDHFERYYFQYKESRVHLCKSTVHAILHLSETIERCGPPIMYSQFWMERYVGFIKHRLTATTKRRSPLLKTLSSLKDTSYYFKGTSKGRRRTEKKANFSMMVMMMFKKGQWVQILSSDLDIPSIWAALYLQGTTFKTYCEDSSSENTPNYEIQMYYQSYVTER